MVKFFLSHSTKDTEIVESFNEQFLRLALDASPDDVYCTSVKGTLPTGEYFTEEILQNLMDAEVVIFLITKQFLNSDYCLAEIGAAWALKKKMYPLLLDQLDFNALKNTPLQSIQSIRVVDSSDISLLADQLHKGGLIEAPENVLLNAKATLFLDTTKKYMNSDEEVDTEKIQELKKEYEDAQKYIDDKEKEILSLKSTIEKIKQAKDSKEIDRIQLEGVDEVETFQNFAKEIRSCLKDLDPLVHVAIFYELFTDEDFKTSNRLEQLKHLVLGKLLLVDDETIITPNLEHPKIKKCEEKLIAFNTFLQTSPELIQYLEKEYEDIIGLDNINFWKRTFDVRMSI